MDPNLFASHPVFLCFVRRRPNSKCSPEEKYFDCSGISVTLKIKMKKTLLRNSLDPHHIPRRQYTTTNKNALFFSSSFDRHPSAEIRFPVIGRKCFLRDEHQGIWMKVDGWENSRFSVRKRNILFYRG